MLGFEQPHGLHAIAGGLDLPVRPLDLQGAGEGNQEQSLIVDQQHSHGPWDPPTTILLQVIGWIARSVLSHPGLGAAQERDPDEAANQQPADADTTVSLASGVLEGSNVDLASSMVNMIELSRHFELQIKALHTAEDDATSSTKLLSSG